MTRPRPVLSEEVLGALTAAGIIGADEDVRRVVIDLQAGHAALMHVERFGDERLLNVAQTLSGVEITRAETGGAGDADRH
jgi:hypothetical protein